MNIDTIYAACEQFEKQAGLIKLPDELFTSIVKRCVKSMAIQHIESAQKSLETETSKERIVELNRIIQFAKSHIGDGIKENQFTVDIRPFFSDITQSELEVKINFVPNTTFHEQHKGSAVYGDDKYIVNLNVPISSFSLVHFRNYCKKMAMILYHELSHIWQYTQYPQIGMPSERIQTDHNYGNMGEYEYVHYANITAEFYPLLKDEVTNFNIRYSKVPQEFRANLARIWVGLPMAEGARNHPVFRTIDMSEFFEALQAVNPAKWGKAVKEFFKSVDIVR